MTAGKVSLQQQRTMHAVIDKLRNRQVDEAKQTGGSPSELNVEFLLVR